MPRKRHALVGRFAEPVDALVKRFTASVSFDQRLAKYDIEASLAHARMLAARHPRRAGTSPRSSAVWQRIAREIELGRFRWSLDAEDVHLNIERRLTALVGDAGKRLHTGALAQRPGGDRRAAVAARRDRRAARADRATSQRALLAQAERHAALVMPGFTHLQVAQPVTFGHHLLAYVEMLERDRERLARVPPAASIGCRWAPRRSPAPAFRSTASAWRASSASRGRARTRSTRSRTATSRSSSAPARRSSMVHLSRLAEELVLWASPRFGFVRLPDASAPARRSCRRRRIPTCRSWCAARAGRVIGAPGRRCSC